MFSLLTGKHPHFILGEDTLASYKNKLNTTEPECWDYPPFISKYINKFSLLPLD